MSRQHFAIVPQRHYCDSKLLRTSSYVSDKHGTKTISILTVIVDNFIFFKSYKKLWMILVDNPPVPLDAPPGPQDARISTRSLVIVPSPAALSQADRLRQRPELPRSRPPFVFPSSPSRSVFFCQYFLLAVPKEALSSQFSTSIKKIIFVLSQWRSSLSSLPPCLHLAACNAHEKLHDAANVIRRRFSQPIIASFPLAGSPVEMLRAEKLGLHCK